MTQGINREVAREALSPDPSQLLEFFLIYYNYSQDQNSVLAFTPMQKGIGQKITWQGVDYLPLPIRSEGFSSKGDNELPRPKLQISNAELILSKYLKIYNNFVGAKIIRKRTFAKFLDDENFENGENPFFDLSTQSSAADLNSQLPDEVFYINRRVTETKEFVEFELSTVFEMDNVFIPNRNVYSRYCTWIYRCNGCRYNGNPKTTSDSKNFTDSSGNAVTPATNKGLWKSTQIYNKGDFVFTQIENMPIRGDFETDLNQPAEMLKTFYVCVADQTSGNETFPPNSNNWQKDECGKKISDCKLRFSSNLRFGGFPGTHEYPPKP